MTDEKAIQALNECEERFARTFHAAPIALTLTRPSDHRYLDVNHAFEQITGWKRGEVIGRTPFDIGIWQDPSKRLEFVAKLLSGGTVKDIEVRARTKNGEERIGIGSAALIELKGETCILSFISDITEQKRAAETASRIAGSLIEKHEAERALIAGELNDYIERLLLATLTLDQTFNSSQSLAGVMSQMEKARQQVENLIFEIQELSHRLRSAKLELLGLEAAAASYCRDFAAEKGIEIDFAANNVPTDPPPKIELCIFRALQQALQNMAGHAGATEFAVRLKGTADALLLVIASHGDPLHMDEDAELGLELLILEQRLKLVGGELAVERQMDGSISLEARAPLRKPGP